MEFALHAPPVAFNSTQAATNSERYIVCIGNGPMQNFNSRSTYQDVAPVLLSLNDAIARLESDPRLPDAVLIDPECVAGNVGRLAELNRRKGIPLILYTRDFDESVKPLAMSISADDYYYGPVSEAFSKRLEFIKRVKAYKANGKRQTARHIARDNQVRLWSMKRMFDIVLSFTILVLLAPLCLIIALIIKLESRGPVLYISKRAGAGYKIFDFYKFRTMRVGADAELSQLAHLNQYSQNAAQGIFYKIKNDPRITPFGQFLRNTSLDEIPQLVNVLVGDMSLVGNRPLPLYEAEKLTKDQIAWRFLAPAGITGLWQISKRGKENMSPEERITMDIEYAMKNSLWLDMKILFATFPALLQKEKV